MLEFEFSLSQGLEQEKLLVCSLGCLLVQHVNLLRETRSLSIYCF